MSLGPAKASCSIRWKTTTGLKVTVDVLNGVYATGKKVAADFLENMRILLDEDLPRWNYRAIPGTC
jgi:Rhodopirellula transposase DDE domain